MVTFIYPTKVERITSGFRQPNRKNHHGIDFALAGTHEIYAVADGVVSRSYKSDSYGECVMIVHSIGGQEWETVYAHMRTGSRTVREGQKVIQGQVLGIMGNTGESTGQHLHFELHRGRWNKDKTNAVNPMAYLSKPSKDYKGGDTLKLTDYQWETLEKAIPKLELSNEHEWLEKAKKRTLTIDELTWMNTILISRRLTPSA